ncbi:addiction module toxin RelE [Desulfuromonas soudanensis]|uniref:Addiction module toxin RelE n=1 Tax=Desulfuromonas soudanensis TaxID=1603606 RepID=A0A0M4DFF7_9BACT|nr:type II toxin-antitoxin system RelE/ParE family toxin [Desulfuromonas soudanensis]ALC15462.1 addiction module toxin RelE [Desulfuromonas soudanensis]
METYNILIRKSAAKELESLPKRDLQRVVARIQSLAKNPRPSGAEKLAGDDRYRIRQGNYRIIYSIQDNELTVWLVKIGHRRDVYR